MDRIREFLRTKGLYIAIGTGVAAFVCLLVIYNYNTYKSEFGIEDQTIDLETPEVTETNSDDAVAGDTDAPPADIQTADAEDMADAQSGDETPDAQTDDAADEETADAQTDDTADDKTADAQTDDADEETADAQTDGDTPDVQTAESTEAESNGVVVDSDGVVVANAYNDGGTLVWPVDGSVILPFSMDTTVYFRTLRSYRCNPGLLIAAEEGENVLAAYEGVVTSVAEDREYGTTVTVEMGNGYQALYGQLMNVTVAEGDAIATAQNIGEAAPPTSYYTEEGTHVFFELTKNDVPINPTILMAD